MQRSRLLHTLLLAGAAWMAAGFSAPARAQDADDAKRGVARISLINGDVSVRRGDSGDWVAAAVNAPVMAQDRITTGPTSRTEVQFDWANMLRIGANAEVEVAQLESRRYMLQLARGTVTFRVLRDSDADVELDTPSVSVRPSRRGVYRVAVREDGTTEIAVRAGDVEVFTPRGSQRLTAGQSMEARGTQSDPEFQVAGALAIDDWDRWNENRDRTLERSQAYRYVSRDVSGAEDLDPYGSWVYDAPYGYVWRPTVVAGWAPYRHGRWAWADWYGWTWVSYDPWGWAPYHYGRWYVGSHGWCWYPGGIGGRHYWSPALVAFFGFGHGVSVGVGFGGGWGHVGWVPLAPHERFSPWWGRNYYGGYRNAGFMDRSVNLTNVNITNVYRNARVANGVTAVNAGDFSRGRFNNHVRVDNSHLASASLSRGMMPAVPGDAHLRYSDRQAQNVTSRGDNTRFFSTRQAAPVQRVSFAEQRQGLERVSRVPVSDRVAGSSPAGRSESVRQGGNAPSASDGRGWRRASDPAPSAGQAPANRGSEGQSGWRRSGDTGGSQAAPRQAERQSGSSSQGGWRRFGDSGGAQSAPRQMERQSGAPSQGGQQASPQRNEGQGGWRRPGDTGGSQATPRQTERQSTAPSQGGQQASPGQSDRRGGWQRFGDPASGSGRQASPQSSPRSDRPQSNDRGAAQAPQSRSWNRFGNPGATSSGPRSDGSGQSQPRYERRSAPSQSTPQYSSPSRQESIRIAPPVVRERSGSSSAPRMERSAPSAPSRNESRYSASSGNSGGSRSSGNSGNSGGGSRYSGNSGNSGGRGGRGR
jgi:hypothetical protein